MAIKGKKKKSEDPVKERGEALIKGDFVPVDENDVARAVDIPVMEKPISEIEIIEKRGRKKTEKINVKKEEKLEIKKASVIIEKKTNNGNGNGKNWKEKFKIPGPKQLKPNGNILIITEKPQAAQKIANALARNGIKQKNLNNVSYYEFERDGKIINVACAVGHLFTLAQVKPRNEWPTFDIEWAPNFLVKKNDFTKKYYDVIARLCKEASEIISATDYDIEGEVIGMNIVRFICNQPDAERMKFSTLTAEEINHAYEMRSKTLDWKQGIAGETRHYLDWIYGINLSRAIMDAIKQAGSFRLMSIGRVQGPALNIIVKKEREIQKFKPEKYWDIFLDVFHANDKSGKNIIEVKYIRDVTKQQELKKFEQLEGKEGIANTEKTQQKIIPPVPFDLTTLQTEAYKFFGLTPSKTLEIAQRLYLAGVISYPRTSSQKLPKEIGYDKVIKRLSEKFSFTKFITRKIPVEGKKTDPAHPSIYPTGEFHSLEGDDGKVYSLIVKRFVSCFCDEAVLDNKKINVEVNNLRFTAKGMAINKKGWMEVYPSIFKEKEIPDLNGKVTVKKVRIDEKYTQPPHRYTPASIISELEKRNLGTKATRASILETLYNRGYIKEKSIEATSLGMSLISSLENNCHIIIDEQLTRNIEKEMDSLRESKNPLEKEKKILEETKGIIYKIGDQFQKNKLKIGKDLIQATSQLWEDEKKQAEIGICPVCKEGKLAIKYGKKFSRYFVACNRYPDCKTTYTLPGNALIKTTDKQCQLCGWPMLISIKKAKRPWIFCFNPNCESRKERNNNKTENEKEKG
ncbi:DNA topoisomerase I [Candidatus Pacearchaeota archaeon]|nr:DNA topoisomerase I [Candidatus Pacearchaeota archaeon]